MKKLLIGVATVAIMLGAMAIPAFASKGVTQIFGPYASNSTDSGTCGNNWANDTMDRVYKVDTQANADGTYNVTEEFKKGTFVTIAGNSPGGCDTNPGGTVAAGVTGKFQGSFEIVVSGGTFNPSATCPTFCYTADFVTAFFPGNTGYNVTTFSLHYNAGNNGDWKNASADRGGNRGDITGTP